MIKLLTFGSIALYVVSLALPAYSIGCGGAFPGIFALLFGPIDLLALHLPWLANPLLLWSWIKLKKHEVKPAFVCAVLAAGAAAIFWVGENKVTIAGGSCSSKYVVLSGYLVWLASIGMQVGAAGIGLALRLSPSDETDNHGEHI